MKNNYALLNRWTTWLWLLISSFAFLPTQAQYLTQNFEGAFSGSPAAPTGWTQERIRNVYTTATDDPIASPTDGAKDWARATYVSGTTWTTPTGTVSNFANNPATVAPSGGTSALMFEDYSVLSAGQNNQVRRIISPTINLASSRLSEGCLAIKLSLNANLN
jgi:hypothetical protein